MTAGLLLAAGAGRRLGTPKALLELDGERLVDRALNVLVEGGCEPVVVVLGAAAGEVVAAAQLEHAIVIVNDGWDEGIGSSLRCGLAALTDLGADSTIIALVDQPGVTAAVVRRLCEHAGPGVDAAVATYAGAPRNPVLLAAAVWPDVAALASGDVGAREWLRTHAESVVSVPCDDLGSDKDIDTAADLAALMEE